MIREKLALVGASGFIGGALYRRLSGRCSHLVGTYYTRKSEKNFLHLDVTDRGACTRFLEEEIPDFLLLLAGSKDVKKCEENYEFAYSINTLPVTYFIDIIEEKKLPTKLFYFSSDYVFQGDRGLYTDLDDPDPKTNYGRTKCLSEKALMNSSIDYLIIRSAAVMGRGARFFDWLTHSFEEGKDIELFSNVYFSPTPLKLVTEVMEEIIQRYDHFSRRIIHLVGERRMSRYEFACMVKELGGPSEGDVIPREIFLDGTTFQEDLSLVQSEFVASAKRRKLEGYLEDEIEYVPKIG